MARVGVPLSPAGDSHQCGYALEVLRCLAQVVQYFSKTAGEALMLPLGRAAMLFHSIAPRRGALLVSRVRDPHRLIDPRALKARLVSTSCVLLKGAGSNSWFQMCVPFFFRIYQTRVPPALRRGTTPRTWVRMRTVTTRRRTATART